MLRRIERLLEEARYSSNTEDVDAITDKLLVRYSNRVQSMIEDAIYKINSMNNIFMGELQFYMADGQTEYDLPFDTYGVSALKSVGVRRNTYSSYAIDPLDFISEKESGQRLGYSLKERKIVLNFQRSSEGPIVVKYNRKIPSLGKRFGVAITAAAVGTVTVGATPTEDILDYDDYFSTVDVEGNVLTRGHRILTYNKATGVITFTGGSGVPLTSSANPVNGSYVIPGKYATSTSELPEECEKVFLEILERRIALRQSQTDMNIIVPLSDVEFQAIQDVFAKGSDDNDVPPTPAYSEFM